MKKNMSIFGVGPRIGLLTLPYLLVCIFMLVRYHDPLALNFLPALLSRTAGFLWLAVGIVFYIASGKTFMKEFPKGQLITRGPFGLCRNPIYASFIVFFLPGLALVFQSGLLLTVCLVMYINFRIMIQSEYALLRDNFGEQYLQYEKSVNEILPLPFKI
jgi:protein-S-isoprenylcysteine O-methyltransferase Ste14